MDTSMLLFASEINPIVVSLIGVSVVFFGLACIIGLVELMTLICNKLLEGGSKKKAAKKSVEAPAAAPVQATATTIENRGEILAAVCAAVAEEEGTDISAIRVISFKKL